MQKFRAIVLQSTHENVVTRLHNAGVVHISETAVEGVSHRDFGAEYYELLSLAAKVREIQEFLTAPSESWPRRIKEKNLKQTISHVNSLIEKFGPKIYELKNKLKKLDEERQVLITRNEILSDIRGVNVPLQYLRSTEGVYVATGRIDSERAEEFVAAVKTAMSKRVYVTTVGVGKKRVAVAACRMKNKNKLLPLLYRYEVEPLDLPDLTGTPEKVLYSNDMRLDEIGRDEAILWTKVWDMARERSHDFAQAAELLEIHKERLEKSASFGYTESTTLIEGWIPSKNVQQLRSIISEATERKCILEIYEPGESDMENVPIKLRNPPVVKDFERLTEMYSLPKYNEIDPTPFVAITFPLFFAICLSDAGYGALLGVFMASGVWIAKSFPRDFRVMLTISAMVTIPIGVLMGGWFGLTEFGGLSIAAWWKDPIATPIPILKLAVMIGIAHILMGFGVAAVIKDCFRRNWSNLALNNLPRIMVVIGFFGLAFSALGLSLNAEFFAITFPKMELFEAFNPLAGGGTMVTIFRMLLFGGLGVGMIGSVVLAKDVRQKFSGPVNVIYSVTGYVADAASYSRLMALGIATAIIAYAINYILGWLASGLDFTSAMGLVIAVPMVVFLAVGFIVGHCFNIFINSLGGFIHTLRLHYVEFFGKFYEGGGEKFVPFKVKRTFTKLA